MNNTMKKILLTLSVIFISIASFGQAIDVNARNIKLGNRLYSDKSGGIDTIISPADTAGQYKIMNIADPETDLDGVNLRYFNENALVSPTNEIQFNPVFPDDVTATEGKVYYDTVQHALTYFTESPTLKLNIGQEGVKRGYNMTGSIIPDNTPVYLTAGMFNFADTDQFETSRLIGVTTEQIGIDSYGYATMWGDQTGDFIGMGFTEGDDIYLGDSVLTNIIPLNGDYVVYIGEIQNDTTLFVNPEVGQHTAEMINYTGWPDPNNITFGINNATRTLTLTPTAGSNYYFYQNGTKHIKASDSYTWTDVEGIHLIHYDGDTITEIINPTEQQDRQVVKGKTGLVHLYWNATDDTIIYINDERHSFDMNGQTRAIFHDVIGCTILSGVDLTGFSVDGTGNLAANAQFGNLSGLIRNEDILTSIPTTPSTTGYTVFYRSGASSWRSTFNSGFSVVNTGTGRVAYNQDVAGSYQLTEVTSNYYVPYFVLVSNTLGNKIGTIPSTSQYSTVEAAVEGARVQANNLLGNLPVKEVAEIGFVIYQTRDVYTNAVKARIVSFTDPRDGQTVNYFDLRSGLGGGGGGSTSSLNFIDLLDTPNDYAAKANQLVGVNGAETGLEFKAKNTINVGDFLDNGVYMDNATHNAAGLTGQYVDVTSAQTLINKTITNPSISDFSSSQHDHSTTNEGGLLNSDDIVEGSTNLFSPWTEASGNIYRLTGNVGIGVIPTTKLDVQGGTKTQTLSITNSYTFDGNTFNAVTTGTSDNNSIPTKGYVDDAIAAGGGYTDEMAQDAVGGILDNGTVGDIIFTYDDATPRISGDVENDSHLHTGSTISGLSATDFTSSNISQWTNDAGYLTSGFTLTNDLSGTLASPAVVDDSHNHIISNVDFLQDSLDLKQDNLTGTGLVKSTAGTISYIADNSTNWNTAYTHSQTVTGNPHQIGIDDLTDGSNVAKLSGITDNYIPKKTASGLSNSLIFDNGTSLGIGTTTPTSTRAIHIVRPTPIVELSSSTESFAAMRMSSGTGFFVLGTEGASGGSLVGGSSPYQAILASGSDIVFAPNNSRKGIMTTDGHFNLLLGAYQTNGTTRISSTGAFTGTTGVFTSTVTATNFIGQTAQTITYSATPAQNWTSGNNATITLTGDVTTYTLSNVPDGGTGDITIIQDGTGGYGINAVAHTGLTIKYFDIDKDGTGDAPTAANINSTASGHTVLSYKRIGSFLYINFGWY